MRSEEILCNTLAQFGPTAVPNTPPREYVRGSCATPARSERAAVRTSASQTLKIDQHKVAKWGSGGRTGERGTARRSRVTGESSRESGGMKGSMKNDMSAAHNLHPSRLLLAPLAPALARCRAGTAALLAVARRVSRLGSFGSLATAAADLVQALLVRFLAPLALASPATKRVLAAGAAATGRAAVAASCARSSARRLRFAAAAAAAAVAVPG
jgi:hypothetical protein